jgi:hypothetical protein
MTNQFAPIAIEAAPSAATLLEMIHPTGVLMFDLPRPTPAMPSSYFWTWDHSCNWVLDDPGIWTGGCANRYLKRPQTFIEDYRQLTDLAAGLGIKGITIYGFLRDAHGGIEYAKRVADYAANKGVAILPGVGLTWYGGPYYEGEHKYNIGTFLRANPQARAMSSINGGDTSLPGNVGVCPTHPDFIAWMSEGLQWLFDEFSIGGVNLENGDFMICHCDRCKAHKADWPADDVDMFRMQALAYLPAIKALKQHLADKLILWATYCPWTFEFPQQYPDPNSPLPKKQPRINQLADPDSVAQWSIKGIVRKDALPLATYLDDGAPQEALGTKFWPDKAGPQTRRSTGLLYQGSQWWLKGVTDRYSLAVSTIKEACLRSYRSGLEGIALSGGEVTARHIPCALTYVAFSHFTHWPADSLREFGRKTLGPVLGSEAEGENYVELLCAWDSGSLTDAQKNDIKTKATQMRSAHSGHAELQQFWPSQFWHWLMAHDMKELHTASFY